MPQGFVQPAQAVEIGDDHLVVAGNLQLLAGASDEAAAVQKAGKQILVGGCETRLGGHYAGGADPLLEPDAAPDGDPGAAHAQAHGDLGPGFLDAQDVFGIGAVLRQGERAQGGGRTVGGERAQAKRPGRAGQPHAVALGLPDPEGDVGGAQRFQRRGGVPHPTVVRHRQRKRIPPTPERAG